MSKLHQALREKGHPAGKHKGKIPSNEDLRRVAEAYHRGDDLGQLAKDLKIKPALLMEWVSIAEKMYGPEDVPTVENPEGAVISEGREQSYYDDLVWAIETAGFYLRTKQEPKRCPNDRAYYLFKHACEEPKDCVNRLNQLESRRVDKSAPDKKEVKRTIQEIEVMLALLEEQDAEA